MSDSFIDLYCERNAPDLLAEPLNLFTNLGYFVSAYLLLRALRRNSSGDEILWLIPLAIVLTGMGSIAFHLFASRLTQALDIAALLMFQLIAIWILCRRVLMLQTWLALTSVIGFLAAVFAAAFINEWLFGSALYLPSLALLLLISVLHRDRSLKQPRLAYSSLLLFSVALLFRSMDEPLCPQFVLGVHFIWHLLTAAVTYLVSIWLLENIKKDDALPRHPF